MAEQSRIATAVEAPEYTSMGALGRRWDAVGRKLALRAETPQELARWQTETRASLKHLLGYDTLEAAELTPRLLSGQARDGYTLEHWAIQVEPGVWMPFYALVPQGTPPFLPVIAAHGHGGDGKQTVAGEMPTPEHAARIKQFNYDYGRQLCREGYIVFAPDARGFGERREARDGEDTFGCSCRVLNNMAIPLGQTVTGLWTWDLHRLVDYLYAFRGGDCRLDRLAIVGLSGGGHQALWAAALDEERRLTRAVISGYFYGYRQALLEQPENCSCNYVPHLWEQVDMGDLGALIAPRPLLIESGNADPLNGRGGLANVESQLAITRRAYASMGCANQLKHSVQAGEHRWYGAGVAQWLREGA